jgi:voltage-gated potassium channel
MLRHHNLTKLLFAIGLALSTILVGVVGFISLEEYSLREAFYMTMLTISTVGFQEVRKLTPNGQIFTSFFILFNLGTFAYLISVISRYFFEGELQAIFKNYMTDQDLKKMSNHIIVCGFGRNGSKAYQELVACGESVIVIEADEPLIKMRAATGVQPKTVLGDATQDEVLYKAGIERAKAIITALPKDADNVFVTLTARELNPHIRIIARASDKSTENKLIRAGADSVVMPDEIGGSHMANLVTRPEVIRFLEMMNGLGPNKLRLEELDFEELRRNMKGYSIRELDIRSETGATVIGLKNNRNEFVVSPNPDTQVKPGDVLLVLGTDQQIKTFMEKFRHTRFLA